MCASGCWLLIYLHLNLFDSLVLCSQALAALPCCRELRASRQGKAAGQRHLAPSRACCAAQQRTQLPRCVLYQGAGRHQPSTVCWCSTGSPAYWRTASSPARGQYSAHALVQTYINTLSLEGYSSSNAARAAWACRFACCSGICDPYDQEGACTPDELAREWLPRVYSGAASVVVGCALEHLPFTAAWLGEAIEAAAAPSVLHHPACMSQSGAAAMSMP